MRSRLHTLASAGAWLFIAGSLFGLAGAVFTLIKGADNEFVVFSTMQGDTRYTSWLLTFRQREGLALALTEVLVVSAAAWGSLSRSASVRRSSLLVLLAWCALWLANALRMVLIIPIGLFWSLLAAIAVLFMCTLARTFSLWRTIPPAAPVPSLAARPA